MLRPTLLVALLLAMHLPLPAGAVPGCTDPCAITLDLDGDGRIDAVELRFDAPIDEGALRLSDLGVSGYQLLAYDMPTNAALRLLLREQPGFDSGDTPTVSYRVTGTGGQAASGTETAADRAPPVLVNVLAVADSYDVRLRWSERVQGDTADLVPSELVYRDRSSDGANRIVDLSADGDDHVAKVDAPVIGGDLGVDAVEPGVKVRDAAGNPAVETSRLLGGPRIVAAATDVGSDVVRVFFNVPLASSPGDGAFNLYYEQAVPDPLHVASVGPGGSPDEVLVTLTGPVQPRDVISFEPAFLSSSSDGFTARGIDGGSIPFKPPAAPLVDQTAPRVTADGGPAVLTQDRDRNGFLDAVLVRFSEPVEATCSDGISVELHRDGAVIPYELRLAGQLPRAEGADNVLLVPLHERTTHGADTGAVLELLVGPCASGDMPFRDKAQTTQPDGTVDGNPVLPVGLASVEGTDGAPPVVLQATTQDRDQDGQMDAYVVAFSEPLVQSAFDAGQWTVQGHEVTGGLWPEPDTLVLEFEPNPATSGSDLPVLQYAGGGPEDLRDDSGNPMEPFDNVRRVDGTPPRILRVFGDVGQDRLRVQFSEPVEGVDPDGPGRPLKRSDFFYTDVDGAGVNGINTVQHTLGSSEAVLLLSGPLAAGDLSPDGTGGDSVSAVQGSIREANANAAPDRAPVSDEAVRLLRLDVDTPGTPGGAAGPDGVDVQVGVSKAVLTFPAVPDDDGRDGSGPVSGYRVHVGDEPFTTAPTGEPWEHVTVGAIPAVGQEQTLTIERLCPSSPLHLAVVALDDFDNPSAPLLLNDLETGEDTTPALGGLETVTFRSASHPLRAGFAVESTRTDGSITWSGFSDPETCALEYYWIVDDEPDRVLTDDDLDDAVPEPEGGGTPGTVHTTSETGARFDLSGVERPTTRYLHVAARSGGGFSPTLHYPLDLVPPVACTPENLLLPDVEAVSKGGLTTVTWGAYGEELPPGVELKGYQVWLRPERGSQLLREELEPPTDGFEQRRYLDDVRLRSGDGYFVTAYFTDDLCRFDWDAEALQSGSEPGGPNATFGAAPASIIADPPTVPAWAWVTLSIVAMLVVGGLVLFFAVRHQRLDESWLREDEDPHDPDNPFGPDPTEAADADEAAPADPFGGGRSDATGGLGPGGLPELVVTCPACTHRFGARGHRPLAIVCPNCSASGTLE